MCTSTQQYKTNKFAASYVYEHSAVLRQPTCCYILHWTNQQTCTYAVLYLKMRNVYQMTWVLSSNDNDGCWHYYQVSSLTYVYTYVYYIICTWYTYISWIRCTRYQRPGTTNHPHHLGADVTFCLPRPQHLTQTLLINIIYPPLHSDYSSSFRVVVDGFCLFALGVVADVRYWWSFSFIWDCCWIIYV